MFFLRLYPWWSLILCFLAGAAAMLAFWIALARIAMGDRYWQRDVRKKEPDIGYGVDEFTRIDHPDSSGNGGQSNE